MQFHVISFEGPDPYSRAGGIATRIDGLTAALSNAGFDTHLWFIGDPQRPGHEDAGSVHIHRWCQWISRFHPHGVYDGEEAKRADFVHSLPPFLMQEVLSPHLRQDGERAVVLAEEWQTVDAVLHLDWLLRGAGMRDKVTILWNANNTFCFERIDWPRLAAAAVVTTVSRYMRHIMRGYGVNPLVIANGLSADAFDPPERAAVTEFRQRLRQRFVLAKVARWDPDKRWMLAIDTVGELKRHGWRPLLIARGGMESHGHEVLATAAAAGLRVLDRHAPDPGVAGMLRAVSRTGDADIINLCSPVDPESRRVLFRGASAVLANSGHEPFGLVGLETMAAGGVACTGCSGEDYAVSGQNALVLQTDDPHEFVSLFGELRTNPAREQAIRRAARITARQYSWTDILHRSILPRLRVLARYDPLAVRLPLQAHGLVLDACA